MEAKRLRLTDLPQIVKTIQFTVDYGSFQHFASNRGVSAQHVMRLKEAIEKSNHVTPVVVDSEMRIIDGQHRVSACRELKIPVPYIVYDKGEAEELIKHLNINSKLWKLPDYVRSFAERGNKAYQWMEEVAQEYEVTVSAILRVCRTKPRSIREGNFAITDEEKRAAKRCLDSARKLAKIRDEILRPTAISALSTLYSQIDRTDIPRFEHNFEVLAERFHRCSSDTDYLRQFVRIYNYRRSQATRLDSPD